LAAIFTLDIAVIGLLIGAIAAAASWRVPRGMNLLKGRSRCPKCDTPLRRRDIVPVLSWFALRGRCHTCRAPVSARYPTIESGFGIAGGLVGAGLVGSWMAGVIVLVLGGLLLWAIQHTAAAVRVQGMAKS
jgi:prepilin signal peptidase PulO-like enzyme (type II secretory pathway)